MPVFPLVITPCPPLSLPSVCDSLRAMCGAGGGSTGAGNRRRMSGMAAQPFLKERK